MIPHRGGLPHSDIHGSKPARGSPWLFAACHVLHRLLVPRHPPNALIALDTKTILRANREQLFSHHAQEPSHQNPNQSENQPKSRRDPASATQQNPQLSLYPTPLNPANAIRGTTLDATNTTIPSGQTVTHDVNGPPQIQSQIQQPLDPLQTPSCPARPGAHQNLIHNTKEQTTTHSIILHPTLSGATRSADPQPNPMKPHHIATRSGDYRIRTDDPLLAKQVLYQLS